MNRYIDSSLKVYFFFSVLAVASTIYAASPVDLPSGLPAPVAWWSFAGQDRITVVDRMGTTAAGTAHAGVNLVPGVVGKAVAMDGKEGVITIPDHPRLHFTGPMSLAAWVKPEQPQNEPAHSGNIVSKWYAPDSYGLSWTGSSYNLMTAFKVGGQWGTSVDVSAPGKPNQWTHVVGVFDGRRVAIYLNGELAAEQEIVTAPRIMETREFQEVGLVPVRLQDSSKPIQIGGSAFRGIIDGVMLFDVALTPKQVVALTLKQALAEKLH